jgi:hypothetical protein
MFQRILTKLSDPALLISTAVIVIVTIMVVKRNVLGIQRVTGDLT